MQAFRFQTSSLMVLLLLLVGTAVVDAATLCQLFELERAAITKRSFLLTGSTAAKPADAQLLLDVSGIAVTLRSNQALQLPSANISELSFVSHLFAADQNGLVLALSTFTAVGEPVLTFSAPAGTTSIVGYMFSTTQGLFKTAETDVIGSSDVDVSCGFGSCYDDLIGFEGNGSCVQHQLLTAEASAYQVLLTGNATAIDTESSAFNYRVFMTNVGTTLNVTVGALRDSHEVPFPVVASADPFVLRYVSALFVKDQGDEVIAAASLTPHDVPALNFVVPPGVRKVRAFFVTNTEGLFRSSPFQVTSTGGQPAPCGLRQCGGKPKQMRCSAFEMRRAAILRQLQQHFASSTAIPPSSTNSGHTPSVILARSTATVTTGGETLEPSLVSGGTGAHFVANIYVVNQDDVVIAMTDLLGTSRTPTLTFEVPSGTTSLQAFSFSNVDGLFAGRVIAIDASQTTTVFPSCRMAGCAADDFGVVAGECVQYNVIAAETLRRQELEHATTSAFSDNAAFVPFITITSSFAHVSVGVGTVTKDLSDPVYPAITTTNVTTVQYVEYLYVKNQNGLIVAATALNPSQAAPSLSFEIPRGTTKLTAFSFCNINGLYKSGEVSVDASIVSDNAMICAVTHCGGAQNRPVNCEVATTRRAGLRLKQRHSHGIDVPWDVPTDKHTPFVEIVGSSATVTIGQGVGHPTLASADPALIHYVSTIYVVDQHDVVFSMKDFSPMESSPTLLLDIPYGVTAVKAFSYCNVHGLFEGPSTNVSNTTDSVGACHVTSCFRDNVGYDSTSGSCFLFENVKAELLGTPSENTTSAFAGLTISVSGAQATVGATEYVPVLVGDPSSVAYIDTIYVENQDRVVVAAALYLPAAPIELTFTVPSGTTLLTPYANHIRYGLMQGVEEPITARLHCTLSASCPVSKTPTTASPVCFLNTMREKLIRMNQTEPTDEIHLDTYYYDNHRPYISIDGTTCTVTVGKGTVTENATDPIHPALPSTDGSLPHWIQNLYVVNQDDVIIAMGEFSSTSLSVLTFEIPVATIEMTAFAACNRHGLHAGDTVSVTQAGLSEAPCALASCFEDEIGFQDGHCVLYETLARDALRRHNIRYPGAPPFTPDVYKTIYTPTLVVEGQKATITVDLDSGMHNNPVALLYARDESGHVVAQRKVFWASQTTLVFDIPSYTTQLTPFASATSGELFQGDAVTVEPTVCDLPVFREVTEEPVCELVETSAPPTASPNGVCTPSDLSFSESSPYACMLQLPLAETSLHYTWKEGSSTLDMAVRSKTNGWLGVSFPEVLGTMVPANGVIGSDTGANVYSLIRRTPSGVVPSETAGIATGLEALDVVWENGFTYLLLKRGTAGFSGSIAMNVARDVESKTLRIHNMAHMRSVRVNFLAGGILDVTVDLNSARVTHGALMVIAWFYILPVGIAIKRYGKPIFGLGNAIRPGLLGAAFKSHVVLMLLCLTVVGIGFAIAVKNFSGPDFNKHRMLGYMIVFILAANPLIGTLGPLFFPVAGIRGRGVFSIVHTSIGRGIALVAVYQANVGIRKFREVNPSAADVLGALTIAGIAMNIGLFTVLEFLKRHFYLRSRKRIGRKVFSSEKINWAEVMEHSTVEDPWVVVEGRVFAVQTWLASHPGGSAVLLLYSGKDATEVFLKNGHSNEARRRLESFYIGEIEDERMVSSITLAEDIAHSLVRLDLDKASVQISDAGDLDTVPPSLLSAFSDLLENLGVYIPYLPVALTDGHTDTLSDEDALPDHGHIATKSSFAVAFEANPPERAAIAFTDIQSSTQLWEACPAGMKVGLALHNDIIRDVISVTNGYEVKTIGDAFMVAFATGYDALDFALRVQQALVQAPWPPTLAEAPLCTKKTSDDGTVIWYGPRVRIGVHIGEVNPQINPLTGRLDFFGNAVNKAARVEGTAVGGSVSVTEELIDDVGDTKMRSFGALDMTPLGKVPLKGVTQLSNITLLLPEGLRGRKPDILKQLNVDNKPKPPVRTSAVPTGAVQTPFNVSEVSCCVVKVNFKFLKNSYVAADDANAWCTTLLEGAARTEGILHSSCGAHFMIGWGLRRKSGHHDLQMCRFVANLYKSGQTNPALRPWDGSMCLGCTSGNGLTGRIGSETQRSVVMIGGVVDLAFSLVSLAEQLETFALCAAMPPLGGLAAEPSIADHVRPIDRWHCGAGNYVVVSELNVPMLAVCQSSWGFTSDGAPDATWELAFKDAVNSAFEGSMSAARVVKDTVDNTLRDSACADCKLRQSSTQCEDCNKTVCSGCARETCGGHFISVRGFQNSEKVLNYLASHVSCIASNATTLREYDLGLDLREKPSEVWLGAGLGRSMGSRRRSREVRHRFSRERGNFSDRSSEERGLFGSPGSPFKSPEAAPVQAVVSLEI
ncbi:Adenylate cyclase [Diplonema papillatum]|nr:Adenylate cyclase [Diplonema papillatum]